MHYSTIGLMLTNRCTANCSICCFQCTPDNTGIINKADAMRFIQSASEVNDIDTIAFTGGEAFLCFDLLKELAVLAKDTGKECTVLTNAYWANNESSAKLKLKELKNIGLVDVGISYDEYHKSYIPIKNVINYIRAAKSVDCMAVIQSIVSSEPDLGWINEIGPDLADAVLKFIPLYPVGGAEEMDTGLIHKGRSHQSCLCRKSGSMFVEYDGTIWPCCSPFVQKTVLSVGNIKTQDVPVTLQKLKKHIVLNRLRRYGFDYFLDLIRQHNIPIKIPDSIVSSCELCATLFNQENYIKFFPYVFENPTER